MVRGILSLLGLVIAGMIYFMYTQPTYGTVKTLKNEIAQYNQALDKAAELKLLKESLLSRFNAFDPVAIDNLHKMIPDHVDNVRLVLDIDSLGSKFNMVVQNVSISSASSDPDDKKQTQTAISSITAGKQKYDMLTMKFSTRTSYENFVQFLEALQSSLRLVDLVSLTVSPQSDSKSAERIYSYDITIKTYWLR